MNRTIFYAVGFLVLLLCASYFNNHTLFSDHEKFETKKTRRRRTRKHEDEESATESNCDESFHMDCRRLFYLLHSTLCVYGTKNFISDAVR